jgi:hypothetical protein
MEEKIVALILIKGFAMAIGFISRHRAIEIKEIIDSHIPDDGDDFVIIGENVDMSKKFHILDEDFGFYPSEYAAGGETSVTLYTSRCRRNKGKIKYKKWEDPLEVGVKFFGQGILNLWDPEWETF